MQTPSGTEIHSRSNTNTLQTRQVLFADYLTDYSGSVLNLGCGSDKRPELFDHFEQVMGMDVSQTALINARERETGTRLLRGDAERFPFKTGQFDLVFTDQVLEHLPNPEQALSEITRVADNAMICVPNDALLTQRLINRLRDFGPDEEIGHLQANTYSEWRSLVAQYVDIQRERGLMLGNILSMPSLSPIHPLVVKIEQNVSLGPFSYYSLFAGRTMNHGP